MQQILLSAVAAMAIVIGTSPAALADKHGAPGGRAMSSELLGPPGAGNSNAQNQEGATRGLDRAQERMSDQGRAHSKALDKDKAAKKPKKQKKAKKDNNEKTENSGHTEGSREMKQDRDMDKAMETEKEKEQEKERVRVRDRAKQMEETMEPKKPKRVRTEPQP